MASTIKGSISVKHDISSVATTDSTEALSAGRGRMMQILLYETRLANTKLTLSGTTLTLTANQGTISTDNPMIIAVPSIVAGALTTRQVASAIALTLPSSVVNQRVCGINTTDGQATYAAAGIPNNTTAAGIEWFLYYIYDSDAGLDRIGISKSPLHTSVPANYFYTSTATTITKVANGDTAWDAMIISGTTAIGTVANATCVCLGPAITATVSGGSSNAGWWSSITIQSGYIPQWNNKTSKIISNIASAGAANGVAYGSTDTAIRKINAPSTNNGDKIQYFSSGGTQASGGVGGAEFLCAVSGYYSFTYCDSFSAASALGLSIDSSQRTTQLTGITAANILAYSNANTAPNYPGGIAIVTYLTAGNTIRPHTQTTSAAANPQIFRAEFLGFEIM